MTEQQQTPPQEIADAMLAKAAELGIGKTFCPSEIARTLKGTHPDAWGPMMMPIRRVAVSLAHEGRLMIYRKGKPVDPDDFKGIYRLGLPRDC
jgi:hypothetical protein